MKRTLRLRTYFTLVFVTFSVLASFTISLTIGLRSIGQIKGEIGVSLRSMAERMADRMTAYMAARDNEILLLSQVDTLRHMEDPARIAALLEQLQTAVPAYAWIGVLDRQGTVVAATRQSMAGTDLSQQPIFSGGLAGRYFGDLHEAVLLAPFVTTPSGAPLSVTDLGVPLLDDDGRVAGVLAAYLDWEWADMARASILETLQASRGIDMTVLRAQDQVAVLGPEAAIGQRVEVPVHLLTHRSGWFVDRWAGGASQVAGYAVEKGISGVSGFDRIVLVRQSTEIAYLGARQLLRDTILAGLGCSLLFVLLGWFVTRSIAAPIIAIARVTDRFRIEKSAKLPVYHGIAEIEQLHRSIHSVAPQPTARAASQQQVQTAQVCWQC